MCAPLGHLVGHLAIATALVAAALPASGLTAPQSFVGVGCGTNVDPGGDNVGPAPGIFSLACDRSGTSSWPAPGGTWQAVAQAHSGYTVSDDRGGIGIADGTASVVVGGVLKDGAQASAGASIRYDVAFDLLKAPDFMPPKIAILFTANGEASLTGGDSGFSGFFNIGSTLNADNFPYARFERDSRNGATSDAYASSVTLWVSPDLAYQAFVYASCYVFRPGAGGAECRANADPEVRFDQAAFDAFYGTQSFDLASTYRMTFSAPVPEASTTWSWLVGLMLLVSVFRRRRRAVC